MFYCNFIQKYQDNARIPCYNFIANKVCNKVVTNISNWILVPHLLIALAINKTIKFVEFD